MMLRNLFFVWMSVLFSGCIVNETSPCDPDCVHGDGSLFDKKVSVDGFTKVQVAVPGRLYLSQGPFQLRLKSDRNVLDRIQIWVDDGMLKIQSDEGVCVNPTQLQIHLQLPVLEALFVLGHLDVFGQTRLNSERLELVVDGSSYMDLDVEVETLGTSIDGSADLNLSGLAGSHHISISGSANIRAFDLDSADTLIEISGSADCQVRAEDNLDVRISGSGSIYYHGNPQISQSVSGSGRIQKDGP
jgi:hypothetical protein